ncbi:glycine--tRNA ligase [Halobacterium bonnevillei]|uniref:glycine--tRNA ligase n=1 Tax=Halobacterium bonnevillei TaxID=2692200 RepID=A0A6B0SGK1_9EURY|nr:glycine--tRNA ligase [Halobacterium bonnevillei]MXR20127.1 glycine--tRNA ligase [Halobacterium bonnevillei]
MTEQLRELARRRGFFFQANEAYGGVSGFYTYGPEGAALKRNVEDAWRDRFVTREGNMEIDSPTVTPEPVFVASGHLDGFDDMLVECAECGESHRADHVVEDETDIEDAETYPTEKVADIIADHDLACPSCGAPLAGQPVEEFNLMFDTTIGPGSGQPGYLRPETAQGMFTEFPRLKEYAREQLPFGVAQIGAGYRNEISPRNALVRAREFTMAELEYFVDPEGEGPDLDRVADVDLPLYPADAQAADGEEYVHLTPREALEEGVVRGEWVAYFLARSKEWFERVGVDMERFRFRQHLPGELAHYASDCWDAESEIDGGWVELEGVASRTDYDLSKHAEHADDTFTVFKQYDEPKTVERATVDPDMSYLGPEFGGDAADVADALEALAERDRAAFDGSAEQRSADSSSGETPREDQVTVEVEGEEYTVPTEKTGFSVEEVTESGRHVVPHVVEPAFGVGRAVYTVLAHNYHEDEVEGETRSVLRLPPEVAPTTVGVFPLMDKDGLGERAQDVAADLREAGLSVTYDDSGNIGRRYRRQDEVGTPYCVTVDYESLEDDTVTLRDRDSTDQVRVDVDDLADVLPSLTGGDRDFEDL